MLTHQQLQSIMPGLKAQRNQEYLPHLQAAMAEYAIRTSARMAAFLAQLAHESGQFRYMEEIWGPTAAQGRYEPPSKLATTLGNVESGDGFRFKGRGPIQITGRSNYRRFGDLLGLDLVGDPARAALPDVAFRIAALFWSTKGLNELADSCTSDAFREITRRINGGYNGLPDREKFYTTARTVLAVEMAPATRATRGGPPGPAIDDAAFVRGAEAIRSLVAEEPADEAELDNGDELAPRRASRKSRPAASKRKAKARPRAAAKSRRPAKAKSKRTSKAAAAPSRRKAKPSKKATSRVATRRRKPVSKAKRKSAATSRTSRRKR